MKEKIIYEVTDRTNDEIYYTQGLYEDLEDIKKQILEKPDRFGEEPESELIIVVNERKLNIFSDCQKEIARFQFEEEYNEEKEGFEWKLKELENE